MIFTLNDVVKELQVSELTVQALLDLELSGNQRGIAVALNNTVVPRAQWSSVSIREQDQVLLISATQGG